MNMQMSYFSFKPMSSTDLSHDNTASITKCHNNSLGLTLVYLLILTIVLSFLMNSLKIMNMQIRYLALLTINKRPMSKL